MLIYTILTVLPFFRSELSKHAEIMKRSRDADRIGIINDKDSRILKIEMEYVQLVKDIELYYSDQAHELCDSLMVYRREKINHIILHTNQLLDYDVYKVTKKIRLNN
jgi:hypothetical protein